jgi:hypothetical protein
MYKIDALMAFDLRMTRAQTTRIKEDDKKMLQLKVKEGEKNQSHSIRPEKCAERARAARA